MVDFVITWVDGNDEKWQQEKQKYANIENKNEKNDKSDNRVIRYRDMECLKYWFRGVEKYAPWVNKIYFVTCGQVPEWLNTNNEKIVLVNHQDYISKEYLPTFNSNVIEACLHKIKNLSEKFVYFNDDMFIINRVNEKDFFKNDLPCDTMAFSPIKVFPKDSFHIKVCNDLEIIIKNFDYKKCLKMNYKKYLSFKQGRYFFKTLSLIGYNQFVGFMNFHLPIPYLKTTFEEVWNKEGKRLCNTMKYKFRNNKDSLNHWVFQYWQFASGKFIQRKASFGNFYGINNPKIGKVLKQRKYKIICINDVDGDYDFENSKQNIIKSFQQKFPDKCSFEK